MKSSPPRLESMLTFSAVTEAEPSSVDSETISRRARLHANLAPPTQAQVRAVADDLPPGITVVIPTYGNMERLETIRVTIQSLADQRYRWPLNVVIADNGILEQQAHEIREHASALGVPLHFADARGRQTGHRHAGYARNRALKAIRARAATDPRYRLDAILLLDDDVATLPGTLDAMNAAMRGNADCVAVSCRTLPTQELTQETYANASRLPIPAAREQPLPPVLRENTIDMAALVAFGGDVAAKTNCLLLRTSTVFDILDERGELFVGGPNGSGEDMMLCATLNRRGSIYRANAARLLDAVPSASSALWKQRMRFGRDHAILYEDLRSIGYVPPGLVVFELCDGGWVRTLVRDTPCHGLLVNPVELRGLADYLELILASKADVDERGLSRDVAKLTVGLQSVRRVLDHAESVVAGGTRVEPASSDRHWPLVESQARFSPESRMAQLAGNIMGTLDVNSASSPDALPQSFLFGVRQAQPCP